MIDPRSAIQPDAIIFDLSEVYLRGLKGTHERLGQRLDVVLDNTTFQIEELTKLFHGEITETEYWSRAIRHYGWNVSVEDLESMVRQNFGPVEGTEEIVRELKKEGYKLGLLSVHAKEWIEYCEQTFNYRELFDAVGYSFEDGVSKPETRAYEIILERLNVEPEKALFIDDSEMNIEAARKLGMNTIHFSTANHLRDKLIRMNILGQ